VEIREALTNLVFNAVDAMADGGTLTLRTGTQSQGTRVYVEVRDSGVGMTRTRVSAAWNPSLPPRASAAPA